MQQLVAAEHEPLTPFVDLVRPLAEQHGVSTVIVVGGSGDYFDVADTVVAMDTFEPSEVTDAAREIAKSHTGRVPERASFPGARNRVPDPASVDARRKGRPKAGAKGRDAVQFGSEFIDVSALEQLVDASQTAGIAQALRRLTEDGYLDGRTTARAALDDLSEAIAAGGATWLRGGTPGDVATPRMLEVAGALNRLRTLRVTAQQPGPGG